ncbi:MAG TPA: biotin--[acetyl-CoA-carboxylase] ligase [Gemmatimonadaceae bacterium]|nr:biotin--[acetyl-CoA-carboxylase] ligase [Gemmatimonadaceae bacterium]
MAEPYRFDGFASGDLAALLALPCVEIYERTTSTLDVASDLGDKGAPSGTLILANLQTAGRGRGGTRWESAAGCGLWLTLLERPGNSSGAEVLSLRVGLKSARALDRFAPEPIRLKWPNDLYVGERKLAGILIEARWRQQRLEWVAIGIGVNVTASVDMPSAAALDEGTLRVEVLCDLVPALRAAAGAEGDLTPTEIVEWDARDLARGHTCIEPGRGTVAGISPSGELLVALADSVARFRSGSLVLDRLT